MGWKIPHHYHQQFLYPPLNDVGGIDYRPPRILSPHNAMTSK